MKRFLTLGLILCAAIGAMVLFNQLTVENQAMAEETAAPNATATEPMLAHMVYFSLNEPTPENKRKMIDACHKYLSGHPGTVFYAAGTCADYDREVNDRDFDIALQLVFKNKAAQDVYQDAPKHKQFIEECMPMWKKVRVFDADVSGAGK